MVARQYALGGSDDATPVKRTFYLPLWLAERLREEAYTARRSQGDIITEMGRTRYAPPSPFFSPEMGAKADIDVLQEATA